MPDKESWTRSEILLAMAALAFILVLHGAIPFLMMPTLGQAFWAMGFSESFAHGGLFNFYAHDFGIPHPAAIAFGLAGVWPASILIRVGMHAADAYAATAAAWLGVAMFAAYQIARRFNASRSMALIGAVVWLSMPIVWGHSGYSMLSWGIALLPFYFWAALRVFLIGSHEKTINPLSIAFYLIATIVAIFMDGYTFMMFFTGASILLLYSLATRPEHRSVLLKISLPTHALSFALAYLFFAVYIGKPGFDNQPIDMFRGWGLDLSFLVIPTKGVLWLPDWLGISLHRTDELYFGDASVWTTTFGLPVILLGLAAWWRVRRVEKIVAGVVLLTVFGFYMALGPSLKINSTKPEALQISQPHQQSASMPMDLAIARTGNVWMSKFLPGFKLMRASYRWSALGLFGLWLLIMLAASNADKRKQQAWLISLATLIFFNLPDIGQNWRDKTDNRKMFAQVDENLVASLQQYIRKNERVAFIPWGNDFIANYLAPKVGFRTYNIGGDKNLQAAQAGWPPEMLALGGEIDPVKAQRAVKMLVDGSADVIVIPYFHMLWSSHLWPCPEQTMATLAPESAEFFRSIPGFVCPKERKAELQPVIAALRGIPDVEVADTGLFATVRLRRE